MRLILCGFAAGCWTVQQLPALPAGWLCAAAALLALLILLALVSLLMLYGVATVPAPVRIPLCVLLALALGAGWAGWRAQRRLAERLMPSLEGVALSLHGMVSGLPAAAGDQGVRFQFTVDRRSHADLPPRMLLSWRDAPPDLMPGQRLSLTARLKRPHGLANPHGFDYEYWLLQRGIGATGYVVSASADKPERLPWSVETARLRFMVRSRLAAAMPPDGRFAGVLIALVIGDQSGIDARAWRVFTRAGIGHLISISGLHIAMIAGLVAACVSALWRRSFGLARWMRRPLPLRCPAQRVAAASAVVAAFGYALLAGMEVPAQRTVAMVSVAALALWSGRTPPASLALAWAAAVALAIDPWAARSAGFWLSFGAVAAIFLAAAGRGIGQTALLPAVSGQDGDAHAQRWRRTWRALVHHAREAARMQWAVTVGLLVPTLLLFQQISLVSPLANAAAIPLVSFAITPAALLGALLAVLSDPSAGPEPLSGLAAILLVLAHDLTAWLVGWLDWLSAPEWAVWQAARPDGFAWGLALVGTLMLLAPIGFGWRCRASGLLLVLPMLSCGRAPLAEGAVRLTALDVGQGAAVLVETRSHQLLYDAGPAYGPADAPSSSAGDRVVVPYLRAMGIGQLDVLMISHEDADHAGGARDVMTAVRVAELWSSVPAGHPLLQAPNDAMPSSQRPCAAGQGWQWDGVRFDIVHPLPGDAGNPAIGSNTRSCVLRVSTPSAVLLMTGDIDREAEIALLRRQGAAGLHADVLLVPHHGSRTSSSAPWLLAVRPTVALFQLGYRNRYHHPHPEVWARYGSLGIARYRSDGNGAVQVVAQGGTLSVTPYRQSERRYWRDG